MPQEPRVLERAPIQSPVAGALTLFLNWQQWFNELVQRVNLKPTRIGAPVELSAQGASIGATAYPAFTLSAGLYRVSYTARVTQAATTSSSLTVTIGWTEGGVSLTQAGAAMTGNTTGTQQNGTIVLRLDQAATITYATTFASVGGTPMRYRLDVLVEALP